MALPWKREITTALETLPRNFRVHVIDEATVVPRGERVEVWFAKLHDGWVRAHEHPNAETEEASSEAGDDRCPPGTIWQRHVELVMPEGSLLCRTVSTPHVVRLDPMEYLTREQLGVRRKVARAYFRVAGNYRLIVARETKLAPPK